jgi:hypothetical protein
MKLKYKKMVLVVTACVMGIGMVTFSIKNQDNKPTTTVEKSADIQTFNTEIDVNATSDVAKVAIPTTTPLVTPVPTQEVTLTMDNPLEKDTNKEVNTLIAKYLKAKLDGKLKAFTPLVNETETINISDMNRKTKYIEKYENLSCYTKKGPEEGSYLVYAYHEVKFKSIDTLAPAMNEFYVKTDADGDLYIYLGAIDKDTEKYFEQIRETDDVMDLIYNVNNKLEKILDKDSSLASFYGKLKESAQNVSSNE